MLCLTASLSLGLRVPMSPRMAAPTSGEHELLAKFGLPKFEEISPTARTALGLMAGAAAFSRGLSGAGAGRHVLGAAALVRVRRARAAH